MKKVLLVFLSILILSACDAKTKDIKPVVFNSYDSNFEITADSNWSETTDKGELNNEASIEIYDEDNQKYLIAIMESKEDIPWDYEEYRDYILGKEASVYNYDINEIKSTKIGDYDVNYISFVTNIDSKSFYMNIYVVETKNYYGQIIMWTKSSMEDKVADEFIKIVQSFKEIEEDTTEEE